MGFVTRRRVIAVGVCAAVSGVSAGLLMPSDHQGATPSGAATEVRPAVATEIAVTLATPTGTVEIEGGALDRESLRYGGASTRAVAFTGVDAETGFVCLGITPAGPNRSTALGCDPQARAAARGQLIQYDAPGGGSIAAYRDLSGIRQSLVDGTPLRAPNGVVVVQARLGETLQVDVKGAGGRDKSFTVTGRRAG
ncbi:hypothetical protein [Miltoncostaea oceani]|uniref:hypothetical protein n=1 Tax=Miltoncostaea oceani TaxID=2843216 RepID=UPI001C3C428B|nr:hypothetical protein [Miltoncostaea oceani]